MYLGFLPSNAYILFILSLLLSELYTGKSSCGIIENTQSIWINGFNVIILNLRNGIKQ